MAWVRLDDTVPHHRKHLKAGPAACWLWVCCIAYAQRHLTDGFIPTEALPMLGILPAEADAKQPASSIEALMQILLRVGLMETCEGGFQVHDYLALNRSKEETVSERERQHKQKVKAGRKGGKVSGLRRREAADCDEADGQAGDEADAKQPASDERSREQADGEAPTRPDPTRPSEIATRSQRARAPEDRTDGVMAGSLPRDHMHHAVCSPQFTHCVPAAVHAKLKNQLAAKFSGSREQADAELRAWYVRVWAALPPGEVMGDEFRFWQARFDQEYAAHPPPAGRREPKSTVPNAEETRRRYLS